MAFGLGKLFSNLPSIPKLDTSALTAKLSSYSVAPPSTLINESYTYVNNTFGSTGPFTKMGADIPSFSELGLGSFTGTLGTDNPFAAMGNSELSKLTGAESEFSAGQVREAVGDNAGPEDNNHKVRLVADVAYSASMSRIDTSAVGFEPYNQQEVVFDIMPEVSEQHDVQYEALAPSQLPGEFQKYKGTGSTKWSISGRFTARTREEARRNFWFLQTLRGWTKPYFGRFQDEQFPDKLGAPPPVLQFSGWRGLVGKVPVVITSLQWNWPESVDWLPTGLVDNDTNREIPFPAVMTVTIQLVETFSPGQFNDFDLVAYRYGDMVNAWGQDGATGTLNIRLEEPASSVVGGTTSNPTVQDPGTEKTQNSSGDLVNGSALLYLKNNQSDFPRYNDFDGTTDTVPGFDDDGGGFA